jgi:DnaK suppressor protein
MVAGESMSTESFQTVKDELLRLRAELLREVSESYATCRELGQDGVADIGDMSSNAYNRDVLFNLSETQRQRIRDIDIALERIEQGEYGICMQCGEEIAPRRLEVRPFSRYCIECKTDIEKFGEK